MFLKHIAHKLFIKQHYAKFLLFLGFKNSNAKKPPHYMIPIHRCSKNFNVNRYSKEIAPLEKTSGSALAQLFPLRRCTKNLNVNRYRKEIAPLEKTSGSALAQ